MTLAKRLKAKRLQSRLSLRDLSRVVGVSFSNLSRIERGAGIPADHVRERLERWLSTGEGSAPKERPAVGESWYVKIERRLADIEARLDAMGGGCEAITLKIKENT